MSLNPLSRKVAILNPVNGSIYTSRKRALRYVKDGAAEFVGADAIRFLEDCNQRRSVIANAVPSPVGELATFDKIKGLPVCGPDCVQRLTSDRRTPRRTPEQQRAASKIRALVPSCERNNQVPAA